MLKTFTRATLFVLIQDSLPGIAQVTLSNEKMPASHSELKTLAGYQPSLLLMIHSAKCAPAGESATPTT